MNQSNVANFTTEKCEISVCDANSTDQAENLSHRSCVDRRDSVNFYTMNSPNVPYFKGITRESWHLPSQRPTWKPGIKVGCDLLSVPVKSE